TKQRILVDANRWVASATTTYDDFGRVKTVTDALNHTTTTDHEPTTDGSYPAWTKVTDPKGFLTQTFWNRRGAPTNVVDPNLNTTTTTYDDLGRVTGIKGPAEQSISQNSRTFQYYVTANKSAPPIVRASVLQRQGTPDSWVDNWFLYDTFLNLR